MTTRGDDPPPPSDPQIVGEASLTSRLEHARASRAAVEVELRRVRQQLALLCERHGGLAQSLVRLAPRASSEVALGVYPDGELAFAPPFVASLTDAELDFVLLHEALHLERATHRRARLPVSELMNYCHDAAINDELSRWLGRPPPAGGIREPGARRVLPELRALSAHPGPRRRSDWAADVRPARPEPRDPAVFGGVMSAAHLDDSVAALQSADGASDVAIVYDEHPLMDLVREMRAKRPDAVAWGRADGVFRAKAVDVPVELEEAMADHVLGGAAPVHWTWSRPSRRGERDDLVRRGRLRQGRAVTVVLDTSGSMVPWIDEALGSVVGVAAAFGLEQVRLVQCDGEVLRDELLDVPEGASRVEIAGTAAPELFLVRTPCKSCERKHAWVIADAPPTDLDAALRLLEDEGTDAALVITDGIVSAPPAVGVELTWLVFGHGFGFRPERGRCVRVRGEQAHDR